jgi:hypothetical protein
MRDQSDNRVLQTKVSVQTIGRLENLKRRGGEAAKTSRGSLLGMRETITDGAGNVACEMKGTKPCETSVALIRSRQRRREILLFHLVLLVAVKSVRRKQRQ